MQTRTTRSFERGMEVMCWRDNFPDRFLIPFRVQGMKLAVFFSASEWSSSKKREMSEESQSCDPYECLPAIVYSIASGD